jgi:hypothetical protein
MMDATTDATTDATPNAMADAAPEADTVPEDDTVPHQTRTTSWVIKSNVETVPKQIKTAKTLLQKCQRREPDLIVSSQMEFQTSFSIFWLLLLGFALNDSR